MTRSLSLYILVGLLLAPQVVLAQLETHKTDLLEIQIPDGWGIDWNDFEDLVSLSTPYQADPNLRQLLKFTQTTGMAKVTEGWAEDLEAWKDGHSEGSPLPAIVLFGPEGQTIGREVRDRERYTLFVWEGHGTPNWLLEFNQDVPDLRMKFVEAAFTTEGGMVKTFTAWAAVDSGSTSLLTDMNSILESVRITDEIEIEFGR